MSAPGRLRGALALGIATAIVGLDGGPAVAREVKIEVGAGGGSVFPWDAFGEVGHAFGGFALVGFDHFALGFAGAAVYPDSRVQARFGTLWLEGRWFPFGRDDARTTGLLQPYLALALGLTTADNVTRGLGFQPVRWSTSGPSPLAGLGLGVRLGETEGLFLSADFRAWNITHGGFALSVGYAF